MKTCIYLLLVSLTLGLSSCVNDKAGPTTEASGVSAGVASSDTKAPTEGMKVNLPNGKQTAVPVTPPEIRDYQPKTQKSAKAQMEEKQKANIERSMKHFNGKSLPNACELVSPFYLAELLDVDPKLITVKDGSGKNAVDARACFFKWETSSNPNSGVLIQVQRNPVPEEFPDWASYYVNGKKNQGDQTADGSTTHRYKDFPGIGLAGAYSYDLSRYVWRNETDNVFMIAFNLESSEAEQYAWAEKIAKRVKINFDKKNK